MENAGILVRRGVVGEDGGCGGGGGGLKVAGQRLTLFLCSY